MYVNKRFCCCVVLRSIARRTRLRSLSKLIPVFSLSSAKRLARSEKNPDVLRAIANNAPVISFSWIAVAVSGCIPANCGSGSSRAGNTDGAPSSGSCSFNASICFCNWSYFKRFAVPVLGILPFFDSSALAPTTNESICF